MISKKKYVTSIITSVLITVILFTAGGFIFFRYGDVYNVIAQINGNKSSTAKLESIMNTVVDRHIDELDKEELLDAAIKGMLKSIGDPYTFYLTADEYKNMISYKNPTFTGIGVSLDMSKPDDALLITEVYGGSGAEEAGIMANDEIVAINGVRCTADNKEELVEGSRGEEGTTVDITIRRNGEEIDFTIERRTIRIELSISHIFNDSIGYIRLTSFQSAAETDFEKHLDYLLSQNIESLIIDLRGNGGGYKDVAIRLVDHFIPKGIIYSSVNNQGKVASETSTGNMINIPFVVLVDGNSASASELFAGAIQDYGTGLLIGTKTFGKGIVQYTQPLSDGSYYQYTAETWLTPNGRAIHGEGLTPDIVVEIDEELADYIDSHHNVILSLEYDKQLEAAINALS